MATPDTWPAWVGSILGVVGIGGGGFWAYLSKRRPGEAAYLTAVNSMAETFSRQMDELVAHQQKQIADLEDTVENLKAEATQFRRDMNRDMKAAHIRFEEKLDRKTDK